MDEQEERWRQARNRMVEDQLAGRGIRDERVLEAMRAVPRHLFVPGEIRDLAYADAPLPIGQRQTISQPYIVALMTELLDLKGDEKVLEIGTGSGYQAAILGKLAKEVYSVERLPELAEKARKLLEALGYNNVHVVVADGTRGLPEHAPFDAIVVTAAAPQVPKPLLQQLADGGRLVLPVGSRDGQILERWIRRGDQWAQERITPVAFVPLVGEHGWSSEERPQRRWPW
jgi:protein-L-isoaspartate(D-aspartate) O-methyltransferase